MSVRLCWMARRTNGKQLESWWYSRVEFLWRLAFFCQFAVNLFPQNGELFKIVVVVG